MAKQGPDGWAIRYAVRIARRLKLSDNEIRSLVHAATGLDTHRDLGSAAIIRALSARYNGSGSAGGLAGDDVPVGARVLAVVRTFQALLMTGRDREQALTQIKRRSGSHLDPEVVGTLLTLIREDTAALLLGRSAVEQHTAAA